MRNASLNLSTVLQSALALSVVMACLGLWGTQQVQDAMQQRIDQQERFTARRIAQQAVAALQRNDTPALEQLLRSEMENTDLQSVGLWNARQQWVLGLARDPDGRVVPDAPPPPVGGSAAVAGVYPIVQGGDRSAPTLGQLRIRIEDPALQSWMQGVRMFLGLQWVAVLAVVLLVQAGSARRLSAPLQRLRDALQALAHQTTGAQQPADELPLSRLRELAALEQAFNLTLQKIRVDAGRQRVLLESKHRAAQLSAALQEVHDLPSFGNAVMQHFVPWVGAQVGALFVRSENGQTFRCVASLNVPLQACADFVVGEGLGGAVAQTGKPVVCDDLPAGYLRIRSGTLDVEPVALQVLPIRQGDAVQAVIEVGFLQVPDDLQTMLDEALPVIEFGMDLTRRKLAMLAVHREQSALEERQRRVLSSLSDGVFGLDTQGVVTFINEAAERMLGYAPGALMGQPMHDLTHHHRADGSVFPREECSMFHTTRDGQPRTVTDEVFWRQDGSAFPIEYTTTPVLIDGRVEGAVISFRDISARRLIEKRASDSEDKFRQIVETANEGIWMVDLDYRTTQVNRALCAMLGRTPEEIQGRTLFDFIDERNQALFREQDRLRQQGANASYELALQRPDGTLVPCRFNTSVLSDAEGRPVGFFAMVADITESKQAQAQLEQERARLQTLLDLSPVGVGISVNGIARMANPAIVQMLDFRIGAAMPDLYVHPQDRQKVFETLQREGVVRGMRLSLFNRQHEPQDYLVSFMPVDFEGEQGVLAWIVDLASTLPQPTQP